MDAIKKECVRTLLDTRFVKVFDLQYEEGKHYFDATRRAAGDLVAVKSDSEFREMLPDAVTCAVILKNKGSEDRLLLSYEYRYPAGRFLLSPPAGLIDEEDKAFPDAVIRTAKREIAEETGLCVKETDSVRVIAPLLFASPGLTDESNAVVAVEIENADLSLLDQRGAVGGEVFDGFRTVTKAEAETLIRNGRDEKGNYFSVFTWTVLQYFVSRSNG